MAPIEAWAAEDRELRELCREGEHGGRGEARGTREAGTGEAGAGTGGRSKAVLPEARQRPTTVTAPNPVLPPLACLHRGRDAAG